jgi:signal transduction histidine kinase
MDKKDFILVHIQDAGVGIEPEEQDNLFKMDQTISTAGTTGETGTGLGLILCKEFVERNKGTIYLKSETGKGSRFTFSLPLGP